MKFGPCIRSKFSTYNKAAMFISGIIKYPAENARSFVTQPVPSASLEYHKKNEALFDLKFIHIHGWKWLCQQCTRLRASFRTDGTIMAAHLSLSSGDKTRATI